MLPLFLALWERCLSYCGSVPGILLSPCMVHAPIGSTGTRQGISQGTRLMFGYIGNLREKARPALPPLAPHINTRWNRARCTMHAT